MKVLGLIVVGAVLTSALTAQEIGFATCYQQDSTHARVILYIDASLLDSSVNRVTLKETLKHERVHQMQGDSAITANHGQCPHYTPLQLFHLETAAYCHSDSLEGDLTGASYRSYLRLLRQFGVAEEGSYAEQFYQWFAADCPDVPKQLPTEAILNKYRVN